MSARWRSSTSWRATSSSWRAATAGPTSSPCASSRTGWCFAVAEQDGGDPFTVVLSLTPLRRVIKDYFIVCESYYQAIRTAPPSRIQAIDMGRRALHDEGSRVLTERLKGKITVDGDTARRLFTLICALHWKG